MYYILLIYHHRKLLQLQFIGDNGCCLQIFNKNSTGESILIGDIHFTQLPGDEPEPVPGNQKEPSPVDHSAHMYICYCLSGCLYFSVYCKG